MKKRGQAAMEFLMTYGWAILAAIIVIGVLALYFRPGNLVGQTVTFQPPLTAVSWAISATTTAADVEVRNSGAETINLAASTDITATINSPSGATCTPVLSATQGGAAVTYPYAWSPGVTNFLRCTSSVALTEDGSFDADVEVGYTSGSGTITQFVTGTIAGRIDA